MFMLSSKRMDFFGFSLMSLRVVIQLTPLLLIRKLRNWDFRLEEVKMQLGLLVIQLICDKSESD